MCRGGGRAKTQDSSDVNVFRARVRWWRRLVCVVLRWFYSTQQSIIDSLSSTDPLQRALSKTRLSMSVPFWKSVLAIIIFIAYVSVIKYYQTTTVITTVIATVIATVITWATFWRHGLVCTWWSLKSECFWVSFTCISFCPRWEQASCLIASCFSSLDAQPSVAH